MKITSIHNDIIKQVVSLKNKKVRDELDLFIVEGYKQVAEIGEDWNIKYIIATEKEKSGKLKKLEKLTAGNSISNQKESIVCENRVAAKATMGNESDGKKTVVYEVSEQLFKKISSTQTPQGIMAVVEKKKYDMDEVLDCGRGCEKKKIKKNIFVVCDNVQDPGNIGTIIRTAEAFSCGGVFLSKGCADVYGDKVVRATMGAIFNIPVFPECDVAAIIKKFKDRNIKTYALALETDKTLESCKFAENSAVIVGNEANGIRKEILDIADDKIKIEMTGKAQSLNAAAACAIAVWGMLNS